MSLLKKLFDIVYALFGYALIGCVGAPWIILALLVAWLPEKWRYTNRLYYWYTCFFYRVVVWVSRSPITVEGTEHIPDTPSIFVANHESSLDIPLLGSLVCGKPHVWLFWRRFAKIPVFGFIASRMNVVVDTATQTKAMRSIHESLDIMQNHGSPHIMIFPEGGRFNDGRVHAFFPGFAMIARQTNWPVVPVMMMHPGSVYPPGSFLMHPEPIKVVIGKPMYMEKDEEIRAFMKRVHNWFVQHTEQ